MILDIIIVALLVGGILSGLKKGLAYHIVSLASILLAFLTAVLFYKTVAREIQLWIPTPTSLSITKLDFLDNIDFGDALYGSISFMALFFVARFFLRIIGNAVIALFQVPVLNEVNKLLGAIFGFITTFIVIFIVIQFLVFVQVSFLQTILQGSFLVPLMLKYTPLLSLWLQYLWNDWQVQS
jgi:uncharacterized membrane protein required for colicin V production